MSCGIEFRRGFAAFSYALTKRGDQDCPQRIQG
jgi:hypothetical protein